MVASAESFRDFEHAGWSDESVCTNYDKHFGVLTRQSVGALLDAANVKPGSRVLDVCTGAGHAAGSAAERGASATGVDFSSAQVQMARRLYPDVGFREADGCALPFPDEAFDCVVNSIGIPHCADPDAAIREAFRVLRSQGRFAFTVYAAADQAVGFGAVYRAVSAHGSLDTGLPQGPDFFLFSDPVESESRLTAAGFRSVTVATVPQVWRPSSPEEVIEAILHGSVRASATLKEQGPEVWPEIRAAIWETLGEHKQGGRYELPMPVLLFSAVKP